MPLQVILWLGGVAAIFFAGWEGRGYYDNSQLVDQLQAQIRANLQAVDDARADQAANDAILIDIGKQTAVVRQTIDVQTVTLIKRIPTYVTPKAVAACIVPRGFVQVLNDNARTAAASAALPNTSPGTVDAPSHVGLDTVAGSVVGNYGTCNKALNRTNVAWVNWYAGAKQNYDTWSATYRTWLQKQIK